MLKKYFVIDIKPLKMLKTFIVLLGMVVVLMSVINLLPAERIRANIEKSAGQIEEEGNYPYYGWYTRAYIGDNWTEAVVLIFEYMVDSDRPVYSAMVPVDYNGIYSGEGGVPRFVALMEDLEWKQAEKQFPRANYWIGFRLFLRPLLLLMDFQHCRMALSIISSILLILFVVNLQRNLDLFVSLGMGIVFMLFNYYILSLYFSMGIFCVFITMGTIRYLLKRKCNVNYIYWMLVTGSLAACFDWFSIPIITYGIPLIILLYYEHEKKKGVLFSQYFNICFQCGVGWCFGYGGMILSKSIIGSIVLGESIWESFLVSFSSDSVLASSSLSELAYSVLRLFSSAFPFNMFENDNIKIFLILLCVAAVLFILCETLIKSKKDRAFNGIMLIMACVPFVWGVVFKGHIRHVMTDHRIFMITYLAAWMMCKSIFERLKIKAQKKED